MALGQPLAHAELTDQVATVINGVDRIPGLGRIKVVRREIIAAQAKARNVIELSMRGRELTGDQATPSLGYDITTGLVLLGSAEHQKIGHYMLGGSLEVSTVDRPRQDDRPNLSFLRSVAVRFCAAVPEQQSEDFDFRRSGTDHGLETTMSGTTMRVLGWGPHYSTSSVGNLVNQPWAPDNAPSEDLLKTAEERIHVIGSGIVNIAQALELSLAELWPPVA
jgi:hypothetical protein